MAGAAFRVDHVDIGGEWCRLILFEENRASFVARARGLDVRLPRGWRKTQPDLKLDHTCGFDELLHLSPIKTNGSYAGPVEALTAMLSAAQEDPKRGPTWWRIEEAARVSNEVVSCEIDRT